MSDNKKLQVWNHAKKTDPSATKKNTQGGFESTTINGYWMIQKATELWGPIGTDWGYEIIDERFDEGAPILDNESGMPLCKSIMHTMKIGLYYPGSQKPVVQYGHTPFIYKSKHGPITDMEAPKKSLTDAIKKALSMLGFSADIFTGEFDDPEYLKELRDEEAIKKAEDKEAEKERQRAEYKKWSEDTLQLIKTSVSINELEALYRTAYRKMDRRGDTDGIKTFTIEKDKSKKRLESKQ